MQRAGGVGGGGLDRGYGGLGFGFGAAGKVDGCVGGVEDAGEFFADACVGAGDDVDLDGREGVSWYVSRGGAG